MDNPRFGLVHTLRALSLHAFVLYVGIQLATLGWSEFYYWGEGEYGQVGCFGLVWGAGGNRWTTAFAVGGTEGQESPS